MPVYRAYQMDESGRFKNVNLFACQNDAEAIQRCTPLTRTGQVQLWDRMRFVAQVERREDKDKNHGEAA